MIEIAALSLVLFLSSPHGQDPAGGPPPLADNRPEVKASLDELGQHIALRGKSDDPAVAVIDHLVVEFQNCGPKDRAAVVKGLDKCFGVKRVPEEGEDPGKAYRLYMAAATALGTMGPESVKPLTELLSDRAHKANDALLRRAALSLGKTKAEECVKTLLGLLDNNSSTLQGGAAEALAEFDGAELKVRKAIFEELLKLMTSVKGQVDADPQDVSARERYDVISGPIISTLQRLSGHQEREPYEWQRWWNKNKKAEWPVEG